MSKSTVTLRICTDCLQLIANGEGPDGHAAKMVEHLDLKSSTDITLGCTDPECLDDGDECGFSWSACQGCGSSLGGDRYHATLHDE